MLGDRMRAPRRTACSCPPRPAPSRIGPPRSASWTPTAARADRARAATPDGDPFAAHARLAGARRRAGPLLSSPVARARSRRARASGDAHGVGLVLAVAAPRLRAHRWCARSRSSRIRSTSSAHQQGAFIARADGERPRSGRDVQIARETFVDTNHLNDYTLPRVSLIRGRKFLGRLRQVFGRRRIGDRCGPTSVSRRT